MNEEQLIATLQACYFGDRGAFNKILKEYEHLQQELTDYKERNENAIEWVKDWTHDTDNWFEVDAKPSDLLEILEDKEKE